MQQHLVKISGFESENFNQLHRGTNLDPFLPLLQTSAAYVLFYRQRDTRALRKSVSMDQSCEMHADDEPDDVMEADTKADKDEGMVGGGLTLQCTSQK